MRSAGLEPGAHEVAAGQCGGTDSITHPGPYQPPGLPPATLRPAHPRVPGCGHQVSFETSVAYPILRCTRDEKYLQGENRSLPPTRNSSACRVFLVKVVNILKEDLVMCSDVHQS